jgi:hypothetical protein
MNKKTYNLNSYFLIKIRKSKILIIGTIIFFSILNPLYGEISEKGYSFSNLFSKSDLIVSGNVIDVIIENDRYNI